MEVRILEHRIRIPLFWSSAVFAIALGTSLVTSTVVVSRAYGARVAQIERSTQTITVKGVARQRIRSDLAQWSIELSGSGDTLEEAYEVLERSQRALQVFLNEGGFNEREIDRQAITTAMHYTRDARGNLTREIASYTLRRTVQVTTNDVERVARAASGVTDLLKSGVEIISGAPRYTSTQVNDIRHEILGEACADARRRAERMAIESGGRVRSVRNVHQGVIQITPPDSTQVASYGMYDTSTIDKDISLVVTVTFAIGDA